MSRLLFFIRKTGIVTTPIYQNEKSGLAKAGFLRDNISPLDKCWYCPFLDFSEENQEPIELFHKRGSLKGYNIDVRCLFVGDCRNDAVT